MSWVSNFLGSSIGRKLFMALTGLFLCLFLVIHMVGNFQLFIVDGGEAFNAYTYKMTHSLPIKIVSYTLYFSILLHTILGLFLHFGNKKARPVSYANTQPGKSSSWASRNMALLGTIILFFLIIHLQSFWFKMKFGSIGMDVWGYKDMYQLVVEAFSNPIYVLVYVLCLVALAYHLYHGFASGFQTLGLNHKKYTPWIKKLGLLFCILIPLGFATQPIFVYLNQNNIKQKMQEVKRQGPKKMKKKGHSFHEKKTNQGDDILDFTELLSPKKQG